MNKKALSPIVATLLLIAFSIALGIVVMNWGKAYIEQKAEFTAGPQDESACSMIEFSIIKVSGKDRVCYSPDAGYIEAFIENGPDARLDNLNIRLVGSRGVETFASILDSPLERGASLHLKAAYPSQIGELHQIKLIPTVSSKGQIIICNSHENIYESIPLCLE